MLKHSEQADLKYFIISALFSEKLGYYHKVHDPKLERTLVQVNIQNFD